MAAAVAALSIVATAFVVSGSGSSGDGRAAADAGRGAPLAAAPAISERFHIGPSNLAAAVEGEEGQGGWLVDCWGAVDELRSRCADEAAVFFLDGEAYLGRGCCLAVRAVARRCGWPSRALAAAVGVTADEAGVLRGVCGGGEDAPAAGAHRP